MDSNHTCLAVISLDSALKKNENFYPQVFLKVFVNILRKKGIRHITDELENFLILMILMILMKSKLKL